MIRKLTKVWEYFKDYKRNEDLTRFLLGQILATQKELVPTAKTDFEDLEFKVFSQWGDDGIIQYLIKHIEIDNCFFVEFGVADYWESNTRFLMMNNNWSGLIMDGSSKNITAIKNSYYYWKYDLIAEQAFITKENVNDFISRKTSGPIGLLHIDIDGNDYWIWKVLNVVQADIVIVEYNSVFGVDRAITIPYKADFMRGTEHHSNLYAGASLLALCDLAKEKGYYFVGSNSAGNNAYFVKKEKIGSLKFLKPEEGYFKSKFRESRGIDGKLTFQSGDERIKVIKGMPVFNTRTKLIEKL